MEKAIMQTRKNEKNRKNKNARKYLNEIIEGKLKDPPPSIMEKVSAELGMDLQQENVHK